MPESINTNIVANVFNIETGALEIDTNTENEVIVIDSENIRLGIGRANPEYSLDVKGTINANDIKTDKYVKL